LGIQALKRFHAHGVRAEDCVRLKSPDESNGGADPQGQTERQSCPALEVQWLWRWQALCLGRAGGDGRWPRNSFHAAREEYSLAGKFVRVL